MLLLHLVSFIGGLLGLGFVTLCLASGLLYLAELIEENSQTAKRFGKQLINVIILAHLAFWLADGLPLPLILLGIISHLVYLSNFSRSWPSISLTSLSFISSCCLVFVDHFAWFFYFAERVSQPYSHRSWRYSSTSSRSTDQLTFVDITTFFALCVWMVPFFLFLSLSASDNVLPKCNDLLFSAPILSAQSLAPSQKDAQELIYHPSDLNQPKPIQFNHPRNSSMFKGMVQYCFKSMPRVGSNSSGRTSSRPNEGLIGGSPTPLNSHPSSPAFQASPSPVVLIGSSTPPSSPLMLSARNRQSPGANHTTTSPRRPFSSQFKSPLTFSATPYSTHSPARRAATPNDSFSLARPLSLNQLERDDCSPRLPLDDVLRSVSP